MCKACRPAAQRIAELEAALKNDNLAYRQGLYDGREERAEKAEADLAAARSLLRDAILPLDGFDACPVCGKQLPDHRPHCIHIKHADAIAKIRDKHLTGDRCSVCGSDPCVCAGNKGTPYTATGDLDGMGPNGPVLQNLDFRAAGKAAAAWIDEHPEVLGVVRSCEMCRWEKVDGETEPCSDCVYNPFSADYWQRKSDVCPTCEGGMIYLKRTTCPDCGGTAKKENSHD